MSHTRYHRIIFKLKIPYYIMNNKNMKKELERRLDSYLPMPLPTLSSLSWMISADSIHSYRYGLEVHSKSNTLHTMAAQRSQDLKQYVLPAEMRRYFGKFATINETKVKGLRERLGLWGKYQIVGVHRDDEGKIVAHLGVYAPFGKFTHPVMRRVFINLNLLDVSTE